MIMKKTDSSSYLEGRVCDWAQACATLWGTGNIRHLDLRWFPRQSLSNELFNKHAVLCINNEQCLFSYY